jgi:hypothetical protein
MNHGSPQMQMKDCVAPIRVQEKDTLAPITVVPHTNEGLCLHQSQAFCWATRGRAPLWPGYKWLKGYLVFTQAVMAERPAQSVCWALLSRSQSCAWTASSCVCHVTSSRCLWRVQSSQCWQEGSLAGCLAGS